MVIKREFLIIYKIDRVSVVNRLFFLNLKLIKVKVDSNKRS